MTTPQNPSRFSADDSALLLIDHQVGTMQLIKNIDRELAAKQSIALAKMAKILDSAGRDHVQPGRSCPRSDSPGNRRDPAVLQLSGTDNPSRLRFAKPKWRSMPAGYG
jgi:hypothetical protein